MTRGQQKKVPPAADRAALDQTLLLLVTLQSETAVVAALTDPDRLGLAAATAKKTIAAAKARLAAIANYDLADQLGRALTRLNDLYRRSLTVQDTKTALACQREIDRLLQLGAPPPAAAAEIDAGDAAAQLAAVRDHLAPLGLGDGTESPAELARLAVAEICRRAK